MKLYGEYKLLATIRKPANAILFPNNGVLLPITYLLGVHNLQHSQSLKILINRWKMSLILKKHLDLDLYIG